MKPLQLSLLRKYHETLNFFRYTAINSSGCFHILNDRNKKMGAKKRAKQDAG